MKRDFSQAANRAVAADAVRHKILCHNGKLVEADLVRDKPSAPLNVRARRHSDPFAGQA
jgi:hypothetical protein